MLTKHSAFQKQYLFQKLSFIQTNGILIRWNNLTFKKVQRKYGSEFWIKILGLNPKLIPAKKKKKNPDLVGFFIQKN